MMNNMITSRADLQKLVDRAGDVDAVGLDTEFVWERTFYPRLGLIQLALSNEDCYLIDPLAIDDLAPLGHLLSDDNVVKIFHDAPQDLLILSNATGVIPKNIFDTRLGAGFAGLPSTLSLSNLVNELLNIELAKTETRTNWLRRPLKDTQVQYGLDDVRYLRAVRVLLLARCVSPMVKNWMQMDMDRLSHQPFFNGVENDKRYSKIKGCSGLDRKSLSVLRELGSWREKEAQGQDRPRGHIIQDKELLCLARNQPLSVSELITTCELTERKIKRYGKVLISCIQAGLAINEDKYPPSLKNHKLSKKEKTELRRLQNLITLECDIHGIDPALIGNSRNLKSLIKNDCNLSDCPDLRLSTGWRKELLAEALSLGLTQK